MKTLILLLSVFMAVFAWAQPFALAVGQDTWGMLEKAEPDECFVDIGSELNIFPFDPETGTCEGQLKTNESYVWGMAQFGDNIFFGSGANVHCLVIQGYLGQIDPVLNEDYVCESEANDPWGDLRPPSLYMYSAAGGLVDLLPPGVYPEANLLRVETMGIRSGGTHPAGIVFLAGPSVDRTEINFFAFNGNTGALIGSGAYPGYSNIRKWLAGSDGNLYLGVGGGAGNADGAVLKWTGDPEAVLGGDVSTLLNFAVVGEGIDGDAAELAEHDGRLFVTTWPKPQEVQSAGLWMSPPLPLYYPLRTYWTKLWRAFDYEPDPVTALAYGGGAVASFDGWVYWGTMHVPGVAALYHTNRYGQPANDYENLSMILGTWRAASIFRGRGFGSGSPEIQLLYGGTTRDLRPGYFRTYNGETGSWEVRQNLMGLTPLYGRGGFNNQYNNYCWTMQVYHGELYVGTMDHSYLMNDIFDDILTTIVSWYYFGFENYGADLFKFRNADSSAQAVSQSGLGNTMNYGIRTMTTGGSELYLGSANPMNLNPAGGWELIRLINPSTRVPYLAGLEEAGARMLISQADLDCGEIAYACSQTAAPGSVMDQDPSPGEIVPPGTAVSFTLSSGPCPLVPACVGFTRADAEAAIGDAGLTVGTVSAQCSDTVAEGIVIEQNPPAETPVEPGAGIDLVVSSGPCTQVPDCVGMPQADAEAAINAAGLSLGTVAVQCSESVDAGNVIEQNPSAGEVVLPGASVDLVVSSGPCTQVPDCAGMPRADAEAAIGAAGLSPGTITEQCSDTVSAGNVISTDPPAGEVVEPGTSVDLVVSNGTCPALRGDLDGDGQVCWSDLSILLRNLWRTAQPGDPMDLDGSGRITFTDYQIMFSLCTSGWCMCR